MDIDPMSQHDIEDTIASLMRAAQRVTIEVGERSRAAADADADYKIAHAKALLEAEGTVAEREARALLACADEYRERRTAEALLLSAQEAGRNVRARLEASRSLAANIREAVANPTGVGG